MQSVSFEREDFYYDLHVPGEEHYLADGLWSHNTGKTRCVLTRDHERHKAFPKFRTIWIRKTLVSLRTSVLPGFEDDVAPGFPFKNPGATRQGRKTYLYPNDSEITLCGMNDPLALRSSEFDAAVYFEAQQSTRNEVEEILGRTRRFSTQYCDFTADMNPAHKAHHLYKRSRFERNEDGTRKMQVLRSRHWMNPKYYDCSTGEWTRAGKVYVQGTLKNLTGLRRARGYLGWWVSQSGQVWETFDEAENVIGASEVPGWKEDPAEEERLDWYFGSVDFGFAHAGVMQVWGVKHFPDPIGFKMYRVALVYRTKKTIEWWAKVAVLLQRRYGLVRIVCDPSRPDAIESFNKSIGKQGGNWVAIKADNKKKASTGDGADMGGIDGVRTGLCGAGGIRRILFVDPAEAFVQDPDPEDDNCVMGGPDPGRLELSLPTSEVEEIPDYVLAEPKDGDLEEYVPDRPADNQDDDGCDATRYAYRFAESHNFTVSGKPYIFEGGTAGEELDHQSTMEGDPAYLGVEEGALYDEDGRPLDLESYLEAIEEQEEEW